MFETVQAKESSYRQCKKISCVVLVPSTDIYRIYLKGSFMCELPHCDCLEVGRNLVYAEFVLPLFKFF